jgi:cytochrome c553
VQQRPGDVVSGGVTLHDKYGGVIAPNITTGEDGIGAWTPTDLRRFLRTSQRPDGSKAEAAFHRGFEWLSDLDIARVTAYLRSLPPSPGVVERRSVGFFDRNTTGIFDAAPIVRGYIPEVSSSFKKEYGEYLVDHVARCGVCHSRKGGLIESDGYLAGGEEVHIEDQSSVAPNITSSDITGIGAWREEELRRFMKTGQTPTGKVVNARLCPTGFYAQAPARDIEAIISYLRTVPPIE